MTKEAAAIIREELKAEQNQQDHLTEYLKTIDDELDNIDKRMRVMMTGVQSHSQAVRTQAINESSRPKTAVIPKKKKPTVAVPQSSARRLGRYRLLRYDSS